MIDKHSETWITVDRFIQLEIADAIQELINDRDCERQRGIINVLERLRDVAYKEESEKTPVETYL